MEAIWRAPAMASLHLMHVGRQPWPQHCCKGAMAVRNGYGSRSLRPGQLLSAICLFSMEKKAPWISRSFSTRRYSVTPQVSSRGNSRGLSSPLPRTVAMASILFTLLGPPACVLGCPTLKAPSLSQPSLLQTATSTRKRKPLSPPQGAAGSPPGSKESVEAVVAEKERRVEEDQDEVERLDKELSELQSMADETLQQQVGLRRRDYPCTADELHYVPSGDWRLALWRYKPPPNAPKRNHPVILLCGIATNAIGYDLHPDVSLARHLRDNGFDTWTLEVRGAGLSHLAEEEDKPAGEKLDEVKRLQKQGGEEGDANPKPSPNVEYTLKGSGPDDLSINVADQNGSTRPVDLNGTVDQLQDQLDVLAEEGQKNAFSEKLVEMREIAKGLMEEATKKTALSERISDLAEGIKGVLNEEQKNAVASRLADVRSRLARLGEEAQKAGEPLKVNELTERLKKILDEGQKSQLSERISSVRESLGNLVGEGQRAALTGRISDLVERLTTLLEEGQKTSVTAKIVELRKRLEVLLEESQSAASPRVEEVRGRMAVILNEAQRTLELMKKYDWDFDTILYEDIPAAMEFVVEQCKPEDGKVIGVGHSMGGILWFSHLAAKGEKSGLAAAVAIASSMDYSPSNSSLKLIVPLATPARLASVPVIPMGVLARTALPFIMYPPYTLAWIGYQISARNMMDPELLQKLLLNNFDTIPVKLLLQMATLFYGSGLKNRNGTVEYRKGLRDCNVPVLSLAGDQDWICPPTAVTDTLKYFPEEKASYRLFGGGPDEHNYSHYDLLVGKYAKQEVFPVITDFVLEHDELS